MSVVEVYQLVITPAMLDGGGGLGEARVPVPHGNTFSRVAGVSAVAPAITGATGGSSVIDLQYPDPTGGTVQMWEVSPEDAYGAIDYNPVLEGRGSGATTIGDFRLPFSSKTPLYVRYANSTGVALPSNVYVNVVVEHD